MPDKKTPFTAGSGNPIDPLSYVTLNIPRQTKPHLVDCLISSFQNAVYRFGGNPPQQLNPSYLEFDMLNILSEHPQIANPDELRRQFLTDDYVHQPSILQHREFTIISADASADKSALPDVPLLLCCWRFQDITRIDPKAQHFTKFVFYLFVRDEQPLDFANLLAVLLDNPIVSAALWNENSKENIIHVIEEAENDFLHTLGNAHVAIDRIRVVEGFDYVHRSDWVQRQIILSHEINPGQKHQIEDETGKGFGHGVFCDFQRRIPFYISDWLDGFSIKPIFVAIFLALGIVPYVFIFGAQLDSSTNGYQNTWHMLVATTIAGCLMSFFSAQPMIFVAPSAAFILFLSTSLNLCKSVDSSLEEMYPMIAIISSLFMILFSLCNLSRLIKWVTSFSDEIFVCFVAFLFILDSIEEILSHEDEYVQIASAFTALSVLVICMVVSKLKMSSLTFPWVRSFASDLAPIVAIVVVFLILRFVFPTVFKQIPMYSSDQLEGEFRFYSFKGINAKKFFMALLLGFSCAVLLFFEHNITAKLVNSEEMRLTKPAAFHLDILVLAIVNIILGALNLPLVVASKMHTFHHIHAMSVHTFEFDEEGEPKSICVNVQETRVTGLLSHLILVLIILIPQIMVIPRPIFAGILAFMGVVTLTSSQLVLQLFSLLWKPSNLPPGHWLRNVKRWKVLLLNLLQIGCIVAIYFIEHSIIGFAYPLFIVFIVALYQLLYYLFPTDLMMIEHGVETKI